MIRIIACIIRSLSFLFDSFIALRQYKARNNPIPNTLSDLYDGPTYTKWKEYSAKKLLNEFVEQIVSYLVCIGILISPLSSWFSSHFENVYLASFLLISLFVVLDTVVSIPFEYVRQMKIEEQYGFNKTTKGTFVKDQIKSFIISFILMVGLVMLYAVLFENIGNWILLIFSIILILFLLFIAFISPKLTTIFYHQERLPDGSLRTRLQEMLEKHGYQVKDIVVLKASEKTTKSNAAFSGFGSMKTIMLFDNLLEKFTEDEILAVFAHEMGHGLHKDVLKGQVKSFLNVILMVGALWLTTIYTPILTSFGLTSINYAFIVYLLLNVEMTFVSPLLSLISSHSSRKAEYLADKQAVIEGYGETLQTALRKISVDNFANLSPDPLVVALTYSHPTLFERLQAIQKELDS